MYIGTLSYDNGATGGGDCTQDEEREGSAANHRGAVGEHKTKEGERGMWEKGVAGGGSQIQMVIDPSNIPVLLDDLLFERGGEERAEEEEEESWKRRRARRAREERERLQLLMGDCIYVDMYIYVYMDLHIYRRAREEREGL